MLLFTFSTLQFKSYDYLKGRNVFYVNCDQTQIKRMVVIIYKGRNEYTAVLMRSYRARILNGLLNIILNQSKPGNLQLYLWCLVHEILVKFYLIPLKNCIHLK